MINEAQGSVKEWRGLGAGPCSEAQRATPRHGRTQEITVTAQAREQSLSDVVVRVGGCRRVGHP
jgi:hypothetical protein